MADFNIKRTIVQHIRIEDNTVDVQFTPPVGKNIAIAYMQPASGNDAAVNSLLNQIEALCVGDGEFAKKIWLTEAIAGKVPAVDVHVRVWDNR